MKIELNENAFWAILWPSIGLFIVAIVWVASHYYTERVQSAFEINYEEATVQGLASPVWSKVEN